MMQVNKHNKVSRHLISMSMLLICSMPSVASAAGLGTILHQVEQTAPQLHAANAKEAASNAGVKLAKSQYWGHAELVTQTTHYNNDRLVNPMSYPPVVRRSLYDNNTYGYGAAYTLPIDIDGRIKAKVNAQKYLHQAASNSAKQTRLSLFGQAVALYRGLQRLEGVKQALQEQHKALLGHQKVTKTAVRVGRIAAVELLRIEAELKSVEGQLAGLTGDEARLRSSLATLLNIQYFNESVEKLDKVPTTNLIQDLNNNKALLNRPDLAAAKSLIRAEDENVKGANREWLPNLSLRAEIMRNQGFTASGANTLNLNAQLSWQFWDGGRRFAHTDLEKANREIARQQYQDVLNQAQAELTSAQANWQAATLQYKATTAGLESSTETERIQSDRFASGRISAVDLIDAEASLARARADHTSALANWWLADDQLYLAIGKEPSAYHVDATQQESLHAR